MGVLIWILIIGFVAGVLARLISPGPNKPKGFLVSTAVGVAGALLATFIGQAAGFYRLDQGAGFVGATIGAVIILFVWNRLIISGVIPDHGL